MSDWYRQLLIINFLQMVWVDKAVMSSTGADKCVVQALATLTDPPQLPGRHTDYEGVVGDVGSDHRSGTHHSITSYGVAAHDGAVGSQRCSALDKSTGIIAVNREVGSWCQDIGEHTTGTQEHIVLYLNALIDRDIVLHPHAIADDDIVTHIDILPKRASIAYTSTRLNMAEMPYLGATSYGHIIVDIR